jgi:hypothetical protein
MSRANPAPISSWLRGIGLVVAGVALAVQGSFAQLLGGLGIIALGAMLLAFIAYGRGLSDIPGDLRRWRKRKERDRRRANRITKRKGGARQS